LSNMAITLKNEPSTTLSVDVGKPHKELELNAILANDVSLEDDADEVDFLSAEIVFRQTVNKLQTASNPDGNSTSGTNLQSTSSSNTETSTVHQVQLILPTAYDLSKTALNERGPDYGSYIRENLDRFDGHDDDFDWSNVDEQRLEHIESYGDIVSQERALFLRRLEIGFNVRRVDRNGN
jgi:hypothetical protein